MSFLDDLVDIGSSAISWFTGNSTGASLARTALTGYALSQVSSSIAKENQTNTETKVDPGVRLQVNPDPEHYVPVVYGQAVLGGIVTDASLANGNISMYYVLTLCERTGKVDLGNGADSTFTFGEIWWDDMRLVFESNGIQVKQAVDRAGNLCDRVGGNVYIYCFAGDSTMGTVPENYSSGSYNAWDVMPNWDSTYTMDNTVFAIVRVDYDATKNIKGLGNVKFQIKNSMTQPGDCIYDYMTNTRYGAGIDPTEIYSA